MTTPNTTVNKIFTSDDVLDINLRQFLKGKGLTAEKLLTLGCTNRGDALEIALSGKAVKRDGLHRKSTGDLVWNGNAVEVKYLTTKTKASMDGLGTTCNEYLICFNDRQKGLEFRLIPKSEIVHKPCKDEYGKLKEKLSYQDNINKGVAVRV